MANDCLFNCNCWQLDVVQKEKKNLQDVPLLVARKHHLFMYNSTSIGVKFIEDNLLVGKAII